MRTILRNASWIDNALGKVVRLEETDKEHLKSKLCYENASGYTPNKTEWRQKHPGPIPFHFSLWPCSEVVGERQKTSQAILFRRA